LVLGEGSAILSSYFHKVTLTITAMTKSARILIIDDDYHIADSCKQTLERKGYICDWAPSSSKGLELLEKYSFDVILLDLKMPDIDGVEVLKIIRERDPNAMVVVETGHGTIKNAVEVMKLGAYDFLSKPYEPEELRATVQRAVAQKRLSLENIYLKQELESKRVDAEIVSSSPAMDRVKEIIKRAAPSESTVLITGPSGTGKGLVASKIHELSLRRAAPFVSVDCGTLVPTLFESELFGHVKGSFTGAENDKIGKFELAAGGTIFFDEICNIHLDIQAKLLKAVEERTISRVGSHRERCVDVRIIAATNKDLQAEIREGRFREDLYYRLNVVSIVLPSLAERKEDIPMLALYFLKRVALREERGEMMISPKAMEALIRYDWPGNVRELKNTLERVAVLCQCQIIEPDDIYFAGALANPVDSEAGFKLEDMERMHILKVFNQFEGHRSRTADALGIDRKTLRDKLKRYDIE